MTLKVGVVRSDAQSRCLLSTCGETLGGLEVDELAGEREALQWLEDHRDRADVLVLGPDVEDPVQLAARALAVSETIEVMLCTRPLQHAQRTAEVSTLPLAGHGVRCLALDEPDAAVVVLAEAVNRAERRRRHSTVVTAPRTELQTPSYRPFRRPSHLVEKLWQHLPLAVLVTDIPDEDDAALDSKILECNDRAVALLAPGGEGGPVLGRSLDRCFPGAAPEEIAALLSDACSPEPSARGLTLGGAGGNTRYVEAIAVAVHAEECLLILVQDVTERRLAEAEQQRQWTLIARQQVEIETLSTPIIQIWEDVLALPIIGLVDEERAARMTAELLGAIMRTGARFAIVDLTGVGRMDAATAERVLQMMSAARLVGASCLMSGVSPAVARTLVEGGVSLAAFQIFGNLHSALRSTFRSGAERSQAPSGAAARGAEVPRGARLRP